MHSIAMQRSGLEAERALLTEKLHAVEESLARLDVAEAALHGHSLTAYQALKRSNQLKEIVESAKLTLTAKPPTIKEMVMIVLGENPEGLPALDILKKINERYNTNYLRTSLSPQLSRLYQAGKIHKRGKVWLQGGNPFGGLHHGGQDM